MGLIGSQVLNDPTSKQGLHWFVWEQTGAAQGQAAREADGASGAMRALKTEITNLTTELGEVLLPSYYSNSLGRKILFQELEIYHPKQKKLLLLQELQLGPLLLV